MNPPPRGTSIGRRPADLRPYDGKIATIVWHAPEGEQADRGRLKVSPSGAVELHDPDSGELRLSLGWRAVKRVLDVYEGLRDHTSFRHLKLTRVGAAQEGTEVYMVGRGRWRIVQGWDGTCVRADVWHIYETPPKVSQYHSTVESLEDALYDLDRAAASRVVRRVGGP